jgi:hypothetical protein
MIVLDHTMLSSTCIHYSHTSFKQQTQVVVPYKLPQANQHGGIHSLRQVETRVNQD